MAKNNRTIFWLFLAVAIVAFGSKQAKATTVDLFQENVSDGQSVSIINDNFKRLDKKIEDLSDTVASSATIDSNVFSVYQSTDVAIPTGANTVLAFDTEEFDSDNNFITSTFTPTTEGYYQFNGCIGIDAPGATGPLQVSLYKNGAEYKRGVVVDVSGTVDENVCVASLAFANGTTDFFTLVVRQDTGGTENLEGGQVQFYFNGALLP